MFSCLPVVVSMIVNIDKNSKQITMIAACQAGSGVEKLAQIRKQLIAKYLYHLNYFLVVATKFDNYISRLADILNLFRNKMDLDQLPWNCCI